MTVLGCLFGTWDGRTLFAGIYEVGEPQTLEEAVEVPLAGTIDPAGTVDRYPTSLTPHLAAYSERLYIDWGGGSSGKRSWSQRADAQNKVVTELHANLKATRRTAFHRSRSLMPLSQEFSSTWSDGGGLRRAEMWRNPHLSGTLRTKVRADD